MSAEKRSKMKKTRGTALFCLIAALIFTLAVNLVIVKTAEPFIVNAEEAAGIAEGWGGADCILVLGASVSPYGPSPMLADRLDRGLELFAYGASDIMLLSGDNGTDDYNEVQAMKVYVLEHGAAFGLDAANVYLDYAGFSTYASAVRCKDVFQAERVIIVTQRYHLYRAIYNARFSGLEAYGVAAKDTKGGQWHRNLREIPARIKDFFLTLTGYTPKIMGEPVPLIYPSTQG